MGAVSFPSQTPAVTVMLEPQMRLFWTLAFVMAALSSRLGDAWVE